MSEDVQPKLEILLITYNRAKQLKKTLEAILTSSFGGFKLTVLNNHSTDNTLEVCKNFQTRYPNLHVITNKVNIGGNANILRAVETSDSLYTWIVCDDDDFDFSASDDILKVINEGTVDLIHMGAHETKNGWNPSGVVLTPKELLKQGYHYFAFSSFLPCNLFKTSAFHKTLIRAYDNIPNMYPHLPLLFDLFLQEKPIYVSKNRIVKANTTGQSYDHIKWLEAWGNTCLTLPQPFATAAFYDQFFYLSSFGLVKHLSTKLTKYKASRTFILNLYVLLKPGDRLLLTLLLPLAKLLRMLRLNFLFNQQHAIASGSASK